MVRCFHSIHQTNRTPTLTGRSQLRFRNLGSEAQIKKQADEIVGLARLLAGNNELATTS